MSLDRTTDDYLRVLDRVLSASNSLMFIDPYLDPTRPGYREFFRLLQRCHRSTAPMHIELHRGCSEGSGKDSVFPGLEGYKKRFESALLPHLTDLNIKIDVVIWPEFHDRYLISDLLGISLPNGFDIRKNPNERQTTWSRIDHTDRDKHQLEFDPGRCPKGTNHGVFTLL